MGKINEILQNELNSFVILTSDQKSFFKEHGFLKIANVLSPELIHYMDEVITAEVDRLNTQFLEMKYRDTYGKAFLQVMNIWKDSEEVKKIVFSKKLAKIAADLLDVQGVRLYHDQALYKEPGGGFTPWHADQYYWPLSSDRTVTVWIPLQETTFELGPLEFSAGSFKLTEGRDKEISDESQSFLESKLKENQYPHVVEPYSLGEVSFHMGWLYHRAGPNITNKMRKVMTMIYIDKDMLLKSPENKNQQNDWDTWCPGAVVGEQIDTPLNPVLF